MPATDILLPAHALVDQDTGATATVGAIITATTSATPPIKITFTTATATSTTSLPAGARVNRVDLVMSTGFSGGTSPDLTVGVSASASKFLSSADHGGSAGVAIAGTTIKLESVNQSTAAQVVVTITGTPTSGAGEVIVYYEIPVP